MLNMKNLETQIEAILLFKNEPLSFSVLSKILNVSLDEVKATISSLQIFYKNRGIILITEGDKIAFGTSPEVSELIESIQKEEFSRDLGKAGLETLSIILYKGPISRKEIDNIRGVNSGFIIRNLLIRGLVEKGESEVGERSFSYKPTIELLRYLGITKREDLPEFNTAFSKLEAFSQKEEKESNA